MKITSINSYSVCQNRLKNSQKFASSPVLGINPVSFQGTERNKEQVIFIGAESDPWSKGGGVGTVMKDYRSFDKPENQIEITPYYKGDIDAVNETVKPATDANGNIIMHTNKGDIKLRIVYETTMQWGLDEEAPVKVFAPKDDNEKLSYFVYIDETASMRKPYDNSYHYKSGGKSETNGWDGDTYAKFSKAAIEVLPQIIKDKGENFNPATIICSDAQTAYTHEFLSQKIAKGDQNYEGIKSTHVLHNMAGGYLGETSKRNMFVNLGATPSMIKKVIDDPMFKDKGEDYFDPYIKETLDETGTANPTMIVAHYAGKGVIPAADTVSEDYAEAISVNPQAAGPIQKEFSKLYNQGIFSGILNPFEDTSVDSSKPLPNALYNQDCKDIDGTIYPAFAVYPENPSYEDMKRIKNENKAKLLERLNAKDTTIITGNPSKGAKINPETEDSAPPVKPELIQAVKDGKGDEVPLFISWGRCDMQKGHDITIRAFKEFAKTEEGKNAILILGTGLDDNPESLTLEKEIKEALNDPDLKGRIVHIDGWAPAYAMASAADAAVFSSRFEPCGLTDIEAMKYFCTPIVVNTQGFKQKNFDPRIESEKEKATSYKTSHEYNLLKEEVQPIIDGWAKGSEEAKEEAKEEFPVFYTEDDNGNSVYDDSLFAEFGKEYNKFIDERKKSLTKSLNEDEELPENWDDWNELSNDYDFKFNGFARKLKDGILEAELSDAFAAFSTADDETKETIFENTKNSDTSWRGNAKLHPSGKSSYELYKERHLDSDYKGAKEEDLTGVDDDKFDKTQEKEQNKDLLSRVAAYATGALSGVAAAIIKRTGGDNNEVKSLKTQIEQLKSELKNNELLKSQIAELDGKLKNAAKTNKRNMIITGAVAAAAACAATLIASKVYSNNKMKKTETQAEFIRPDAKNGGQNTVNQIKNEQRNAQAPAELSTYAAPSLAEFQNNLDKIA